MASRNYIRNCPRTYGTTTNGVGVVCNVRSCFVSSVGRPSGACGRLHSCRRVVLMGGRVKLGGLCGLVSGSGVSCFCGGPEVPGDRVVGRHRKLVVNSTYRTNRLCHTVLRRHPRRRVVRVTSFCSCLRVRPMNGGHFVVSTRSSPSTGGPSGGGRFSGVAYVRSVRGVGHGIVTVTSGLNGPIITAYSIRFVSPRSTGCHTVLVTTRNFASTSGRTPLCFEAARRVLGRFSCLNRRATRRVIVRGPGGVTSVVSIMHPFPVNAFRPSVSKTRRRLESVY